MVHSVPHHLIKCMHFSYTAPGFTALIGGRPSVYVIPSYVHSYIGVHIVYITYCTSKEVVYDSSPSLQISSVTSILLPLP